MGRYWKFEAIRVLDKCIKFVKFLAKSQNYKKNIIATSKRLCSHCVTCAESQTPREAQLTFIV